MTCVRYWFARLMQGFMPFMISNRLGVSLPKVESFFDAVRCNEGANLPIGAAGFCWGGRHAIYLAHGGVAANGKPLVDAVFTAHPSSVVVPGEIEKVKKPLSIAVGDKDFVFGKAQVEQSEKIFTKFDFKCEMTVYPGVGHGFAVRAEPESEKLMQSAYDAEEQAIHWFHQHFGKTTA